jgi:2-polyprenyl-3-methyl-5-hydroxy-6-metoxy-1,4-benzoquinol methylase
MFSSRKDNGMPRIWSRPLGETNLDGPDYWDYFGARLAEHAAIFPGARLLDVGCGTGSSLFPAAEKTGVRGYITGIDICPG